MTPDFLAANIGPTGLAPGAQAGIAVAIIVLALLAIIGIILIIRYRMKQKQDILMGAVEAPPPEYASMLTIQSNELSITKKLGEGSFGAVVSFLRHASVLLILSKSSDSFSFIMLFFTDQYLGTYKGEEVAIKKLANTVSGGGQLNEFFRESALMLSIKPHPNILRPIGMCQEVKNYALVMELVPGGSLDSFLKKTDVEWTDELQVKLIKGIAAGMCALASQNIIHRDVRPSVAFSVLQLC